MTTMFKRFVKDESGATAIEYALIAALMATALITAMGVLGDGIEDGFTSVVAKMKI